jgi:hypothetical protein
MNSYPLSDSIGPSLVPQLQESGVEAQSILDFYDSLRQVEDKTETLLTTLTSSAATPPRNEREAQHNTRHLNMLIATLQNESSIAHIRGLFVLHTLQKDTEGTDLVLQLNFEYLEPSEPLDEDNAQKWVSQLLVERALLVQERTAVLQEAQELFDAVLAEYESLNELVVLNPDDTWNEVVGKATALRELGRIEESATMFKKYGEMFEDIYPGSQQYAEVAQKFTHQAQSLGLIGGNYVYEILGDGPAARAGMQIGDIIIAINGEYISNAVEFDQAIQSAHDVSTLTFTYLRIDEGGAFNRYTITVEGRPIGFAVMPI